LLIKTINIILFSALKT